jgi:hypothetical protein
MIIARASVALSITVVLAGCRHEPATASAPTRAPAPTASAAAPPAGRDDAARAVLDPSERAQPLGAPQTLDVDRDGLEDAVYSVAGAGCVVALQRDDDWRAYMLGDVAQEEGRACLPAVRLGSGTLVASIGHSTGQPVVVAFWQFAARGAPRRVWREHIGDASNVTLTALADDAVMLTKGIGPEAMHMVVRRHQSGEFEAESWTATASSTP